MHRPKPVAKFFIDYHIPGIHMMISDYSDDGGVYKDFVAKTVPLLLEKRRLFIKRLKESIKQWNDPNRCDYVPRKPKKKKRRWGRCRRWYYGSSWWASSPSHSWECTIFKHTKAVEKVIWKKPCYIPIRQGIRH